MAETLANPEARKVSASGFSFSGSVGQEIAEVLNHSTAWLHRRVDKLVLFDLNDAERRVSIDVSLSVRRAIPVHAPAGNEFALILGALPKRMNRQMSTSGPDGIPLPVADSSVSSLLAEEFVLHEFSREGELTDDIRAFANQVGRVRDPEKTALLKDHALLGMLNPIGRARVGALIDSFFFIVYVSGAWLLKYNHCVLKYSTMWQTYPVRRGFLQELFAALGGGSVDTLIPAEAPLVIPASYHLEIQTPSAVYAEELRLTVRSQASNSDFIRDTRFGTVAHVTAHYRRRELSHPSAILKVRADARGRPRRVLLSAAASLLTLLALPWVGSSASWLASLYVALGVASLVLGTSIREHETVAQVTRPLDLVSVVLASALGVAAFVAAYDGTGPWRMYVAAVLAVPAFGTLMLGLRGERHFFRRLRESDGAAPPSQGTSPSVIVVGDLCIDRNEADGQVLKETWGSPTLFIAQQLKEKYSLEPEISGPYGIDLAPLIREFRRDREPDGQRSLSYKNIVKTGSRSDAKGVVAQERTQYWRSADRPLQPIVPRSTWKNVDLVYFCPLVPGESRAADIQAIAALRRRRRATFVLLAQGLMRANGAAAPDSYNCVDFRQINDEEAATWSCFDIVVFSDDDQPDAVAKAIRWSALDSGSDTGFIVTQGEQGATLCYRGRATPFLTEPVVKEQSPVGAGDVFGAAVGAEFHAAYVTEGIARLASLERAVERANSAASRFVEQAWVARPKGRGWLGHVKYRARSRAR